MLGAPAPMSPRARIELQATSASGSCDSLLRVSSTDSLGLEMQSSAMASGTVLKTRNVKNNAII